MTELVEIDNMIILCASVKLYIKKNSPNLEDSVKQKIEETLALYGHLKYSKDPENKKKVVKMLDLFVKFDRYFDSCTYTRKEIEEFLEKFRSD